MSNGGLIIRNSKKDYIVEKTPFGRALKIEEEIKPLGRLEKILKSPLASYPLVQKKLPSCVSCAITFLNQYNSFFQSNNPTHLSWPFLYASVDHFPGGTIPQQGLNVLRKIGQPEDKIFPQKKFVDDPDLAEMAPRPEEFVGAEDFKISSYFFFKEPKIEKLYSYLKDTPLIIGIGVDENTWTEWGVTVPGKTHFHHAVVLVDVDEHGNLIVISWDKEDKLDVRTLRSDYKILMAATIRDLPDNVTPSDIRRGFSIFDLAKNLLSFL